MSGRFVGFGKKLFDLAKGKGEKSSTVATIVGVTPKVPKSKIAKAMSDLNKTVLKTKGTMKKDVGKVSSMIDEQSRALRQTQQKQKGEKVTESGVSKGKDLREKKMGGGMMGRRMGYSEGTLKPVDPKKQKGLSKLPKQVRNKMGYMKKGGQVKKDKKMKPLKGGPKPGSYDYFLMNKDKGKMKRRKMRDGGNTSRMNRLEELGRVDAEKGRTRKGKRNLRDEKKRIVRELKR